MAELAHPYAHILIALDGSELAERILPYATTLARAFNARITLVRSSESVESVAVLEASGGMPPVVVPAADPQRIADLESQNARSYLEAAAQRLAGEGFVVDWQQPEDAPGPAIVDTATRIGADVIALTTHGRGGIARAVLGSVSDYVVRHAPCPLLMLRVGEQP
jgi:nucleotide-binding universal stress UspA family protein